MVYTCTHGFDPATGEPKSGTHMKEGDVFSAAAMALGIDCERLHDLKVMMRRG